VGSRFQNLVISFFGALSSRLERRRNERGDKQPEQNRRDHQREREHHRGHLAIPGESKSSLRRIRFQVAERRNENPRPQAGGSRFRVGPQTNRFSSCRGVLLSLDNEHRGRIKRECKSPPQSRCMSLDISHRDAEEGWYSSTSPSQRAVKHKNPSAGYGPVANGAP
jgi:hypothetical protein